MLWKGFAVEVPTGDYTNNTAQQLRQRVHTFEQVGELLPELRLPRRYNRTYGGKTRVAHVNKRAVSASVREIIKRVRRQTPDKVTNPADVVVNAKRSATQAVNNFRARISDTYTPIERANPDDIDTDALLVDLWDRYVRSRMRARQTPAQQEAFDSTADWDWIAETIIDHAPRKVDIASFILDGDELAKDLITENWDKYHKTQADIRNPALGRDAAKAMLIALKET